MAQTTSLIQYKNIDSLDVTTVSNRTSFLGRKKDWCDNAKRLDPSLSTAKAGRMFDEEKKKYGRALADKINLEVARTQAIATKLSPTKLGFNVSYEWSKETPKSTNDDKIRDETLVKAAMALVATGKFATVEEAMAIITL